MFHGLTHRKCVNLCLIHAQFAGESIRRMSQDNLENFEESGDDTARYDDRGGENSVAHIHERLESRMNNLELYIRSVGQRNESSAHALLRQSPYLPQGHCPPHVTESNKNQTPYQAKDSLSRPESVTAGTQAEMKTVLILIS